MWVTVRGANWEIIIPYFFLHLGLLLVLHAFQILQLNSDKMLKMFSWVKLILFCVHNGKQIPEQLTIIHWVSDWDGDCFSNCLTRETFTQLRRIRTWAFNVKGSVLTRTMPPIPFGKLMLHWCYLLKITKFSITFQHYTPVPSCRKVTCLQAPVRCQTEVLHAFSSGRKLVLWHPFKRKQDITLHSLAKMYHYINISVHFFYNSF